MIKRIITSLLGLPILIVMLIYGGLPLRISCFAIALIGLLEYYNAFALKSFTLKFIGIFFAVVYFLPFNLTFNSFMLFNWIFMSSLLITVVFRHTDIKVSDCALVFFGFYYIVVALSFIYLVRMYAFGQYLVWLIFICAWGSDTGAYFFGVFLGKRKLAPVLSPKKTIEGAIGGIFVASLLAFIFGWIVTRSVTQVNITLPCTLIGASGAILSIFGDLAASAIKRQTGVKDFGKIIPGHGGVLDRFDSIIFTAPCVYIVMSLIIK